MTKFLNSDGLSRLVALIKQALGGKQDTLVSGTNIKTVNSNSILGSGNLNLKANNILMSDDDPNGDWLEGDSVEEALDALSGTVAGKQATLVSGTNIKTINNTSLLGSGNITLGAEDVIYSGEENYNLQAGDDLNQSLDNLDTAIHNLDSIVGEEILTPTIVEHSYIVRDPVASRGNLATSNPWRVEVFKGLSEGENLLVTYSGTDINSSAQVAGWYTDGDNLINDNYSFISNLNGYAQNIVGKTYLITVPNSTIKALALSLYTTVQAEVKRIGRIQAEVHEIENPNEIESISTTESSVSGGNNTVTITETNGTTTTFNVKNGVDGVSLGEVGLVQTTGNATDKVMSQNAVTEYGRKVTAEDLNGTSEWIRAKLTEEGWEFGKILNSNGTIGGVSNWMCVSPMFPCSTNHSFLFQPKKTNNPGNCMLAFYNGSDAFKGSTVVAVIDGTQTYTPTDSTITQLRFSCNMNDLSNVFVKDTTTEEYIFKGDEDIKNLIADSGNIVSYGVLEGSIIKHTSGESSISLMSQRAITDAIARQNGFEASEGMATINYDNVYTKLTQRQVERLNSAEVATFHILAKPIKSHAFGMFGASFFVSKDSLGYRIYQSSGSIVVNGITIATYNTIGMFPVSRYFVCDRVNGVVRLYTGTKLLAEVQNDSFKKDKFIGDDGIFYFHSGYYKAVLYEIKIFDFDAFSLSYNDTIFNYNLRDAEVATMNTDSVKNAFNLFDTTVYTKNKPTVATNNAQYSRTTDSEGYSTISVSPTATTTCILQQNPQSFDTSHGNVYNYGQSMVKEIIFDLEVISGNINLATNTTGDALEIKKVIDESGNIIDDASNCGIGVYHIHIITSNPNTGIIKSAGVSCVFRLLSASIKMQCCVAHLSFNKWYNGEIYDDEANTYYHLYSDASLSKEPTNVALSPEIARRNGTLKLNYPQFIGQIAITSSGIFMGNQDYTWKQINNS